MRIAVATILCLTILPASAQKYSNEEAGQYTCEDVRWAKANLPPKVIAAIKKRMTKIQLLKATACLLKGPNESSNRVDYPVRDIAQ